MNVGLVCVHILLAMEINCDITFVFQISYKKIFKDNFLHHNFYPLVLQKHMDIAFRWY